MATQSYEIPAQGPERLLQTADTGAGARRKLGPGNESKRHGYSESSKAISIFAFIDYYFYNITFFYLKKDENSPLIYIIC